MEIRKATKADLDAVENSYRELLQNIKPEENYSGWILDVDGRGDSGRQYDP